MLTINYGTYYTIWMNKGRISFFLSLDIISCKQELVYGEDMIER